MHSGLHRNSENFSMYVQNYAYTWNMCVKREPVIEDQLTEIESLVLKILLGFTERKRVIFIRQLSLNTGHFYSLCV